MIKHDYKALMQQRIIEYKPTEEELKEYEELEKELKEYEELEKEFLGDPVKKTGIYADKEDK